MFTGTRGEDDMGSTTTVDGLVSGMNTSQVISQLMQLAAQPQTNLKNAVTKENAVISAYQSVNSRLAALQTAGICHQGNRVRPGSRPRRPRPPPP